MKILLAGGGTMGSASPLLAIYEEAQAQGKSWDWFWVGTKHGVEKEVVESHNIKYEWVPTAKFRRYISLHTIIDPLLLILSLFRSLLIIATIKPDIIIGSGSFVSVPIIWAGWLFRRKIIVHQQDIRATLSNKLVAWTATKITVSFKKSLQDFPEKKTILLGNPVRNELVQARAERAFEKFKLNKNLPVILIIGGSSGAVAINKWTWEYISQLCNSAQVIHITGKHKQNQEIKHEQYHQIEFLNKDMSHVLKAADIVVSRAGISTISELAYVNKASIIIPMPGTHQEENAHYLADERAAVVYRQDHLDDRVVKKILHLLDSKEERKQLGQHIYESMKPGARVGMIKILEELSHD